MTSETNHRPRPGKASLGVTAAACAVFVAGMVGAAFASAPLYRIFCQVTGYGGVTQRASAAPTEVLARTTTIRFDANIGNGLGWSFRPLVREMKVKVGEVAKADFRVENRMDRTTTGTAAFNVAPGEAGAYFSKIACFCFTAQTLKPGEVADLPVTFFVDPAIAKEPELDSVDTITLSYTFYPAPDAAQPAKPVAAAAPPARRGAL
jgi:cytochrome c oxidase assembly protein subunit 11